jgi:hypothetical protein
MPERCEPVWDYLDLALFLGAILPCLALAALFMRATRMVAPHWFFSEAARTLVFQSFWYVFLVGALYLVIALRYREPFLTSLGWTFPIPGAFWCWQPGLLAASTFPLGVLLRAPTVTHKSKV